MLIAYQLSQTSIILRVKLRQDTTGANPGDGATGLSNTSSGLVIATIADVEATTTAYTSSGSTILGIATLGTYAAPSSGSCRFAQVDATNHPGIYELQLANARYAVTSAKSLLVSIIGLAGVADCDVVIPLLSINPYDGVHGGLSALPNTACATNGSLITSGTGTAQLSTSGGEVTVGTNQDKTGYSLATAPPTASQIATAVLTDTAAGDTSVSGSVGAIIVRQLASAFGAAGSSTFTAAALQNAPGGGGSSTVTVGGYASGEDPATLILGATASSWASSGTIDQKINAAGGAADPLTNLVPGNYASGSAGAALGRIGTASINVVSPVAVGGAIAIYYGDDYLTANNRALSWTDTAGIWPNLTGATIYFAVNADGLVTTGTCTNPGASAQNILVQLTSAQTKTFAQNVTGVPPLPPAKYPYSLVAVLSGGQRVTLAASLITINPSQY